MLLQSPKVKVSRARSNVTDQSRGPMTHGSKFHRHAGSNGAASDPSKVFKGKKMPGQMGNKKITVQNLEIVRVDAENNLLLVKGSVPGPKKCLVTIKETVKAQTKLTTRKEEHTDGKRICLQYRR